MIGESSRGARQGLLLGAAGVAALTGAMVPFREDLGLLNAGLLFVLLTLLISATWGRAAGFCVAVVSNLALNFFFVPPYHRLTVADARDTAGLAIFLLVSLIGSSLLDSSRRSAAQASRRHAQTEVLLRLNRAMIGRTDPEGALESVCQQVIEAFAATGAAVLARGEAGWHVLASAGTAAAARAPGPEERAMAERASASGGIEATGRSGLRQSRGPRVISRYWRKRDHAAVIITPLMIGEAALGVLRLDRQGGTAPDTDDPTELLEAFANEAALALQRVELAEQAARSQALAEAGEVKTALMMSISHDLKTPLATIKTSVSSLLDHSVPWTEEDREAFLETIDSQADYLNRAISEILDWNRVETGMVRPLLKQVLSADLLADAVERTGPSMRGRNVSIEADSGLALELDPSLVVQALVNLLENADKYSDPGGEVRLRTYRDQGRGVLSVEDQGPGIAADDLPHIFERFYRSRREGTRARGSGLGLALVKAFVEASGGTVEVESSSSGSTFRLVFPALAPTERRSA